MLMSGKFMPDEHVTEFNDTLHNISKNAEETTKQLETQTNMMKSNRRVDTVPQHIKEVRDAMREFIIGMGDANRATERTNDILTRPGKTGTKPFQIRESAG